MADFSIEVIHEKKFRDMRKDWDFLAADEKSNVFRLFDWSSNWWSVYGYNKELLIFLVRRNGKPIALAPFVVTREPFNRLPARKVEFIYRTNFMIMSDREKAIELIFGKLDELRAVWDVLDLTDLNDDKPLLESIKKESAKRGYECIVKKGHPYPYIDMACGWKSYWASRKTRFRKNLARSERLAAKKGDIRVNIGIYGHEQERELEQGLKKMTDLSLKSWKAEKGIALGCNRHSRDFFGCLADTFSKKGKIEISFLEHKGTPIAGTIGIIYENIFYGFNTFYNSDYAKISPGNILMFAIIKKMFEDGFLRAELLKGLPPYKFLWLNGIHEKYDAVIFRKSPRSRILKFSETHVRKWLKREKDVAYK